MRCLHLGSAVSVYKASLLLIIAAASVGAYKRGIISHLVQIEQYSPSEVSSSSFSPPNPSPEVPQPGVLQPGVPQPGVPQPEVPQPEVPQPDVSPASASAVVPTNKSPHDSIRSALAICNQTKQPDPAIDDSALECHKCLDVALKACGVSHLTAVQFFICQHPVTPTAAAEERQPSERNSQLKVTLDEFNCLVKARECHHRDTTDGEDGVRRNLENCSNCVEEALSECNIPTQQILYSIECGVNARIHEGHMRI